MNIVKPGSSTYESDISVSASQEVRFVSHNDPLVPIVDLINKHLWSDAPKTLIELGGGPGLFDLAERMHALGWRAVGLGRAAVDSSTYVRVDDYRSELTGMEIPAASVVVARLAFYPMSSANSPRIYPWDHLHLDQRGFVQLCAEQHLPDPMVFPIRRVLRSDGIFVRTMRAEGIGTPAEIPAEMMRRSGLVVEESIVEDFAENKFLTTVYRAVPRLEFGGALVYDIDGELRRLPYEVLLRRALTEDIRFVPETEGKVTMWHIKTPAAPQPLG